MAVDYVHWWPALDYTKINVDEENVVFNKSGGTRQKESNRWPKNKSATCRSINVRRGSHDRSIINKKCDPKLTKSQKVDNVIVTVQRCVSAADQKLGRFGIFSTAGAQKVAGAV